MKFLNGNMHRMKAQYIWIEIIGYTTVVTLWNILWYWALTMFYQLLGKNWKEKEKIQKIIELILKKNAEECD